MTYNSFKMIYNTDILYSVQSWQIMDKQKIFLLYWVSFPFLSFYLLKATEAKISMETRQNLICRKWLILFPLNFFNETF